MMKMRGSGKSSAATVLAVVVVGVLAVRLPLQAAESAAGQAFFNPIVDVYMMIDRSFLGEADYAKMQEGAINGMLEALDDEYTVYIPPAGISEFNKVVRGEFVGIGAEIVPDRGFIRVVSPLDGSPALAAGVEADDLLIAVDGESIYQLAPDDVIGKLTGVPGTTVVVTLEREGDDSAHPVGAKPALGGRGDDALAGAPPREPGSTRFDLPIVRDRIRTETVKGVHRHGEEWDYFVDPGEKIAYIRLSQFTDDTAPRLAGALQALTAQGMRGLVLDLRDNGGGSLQSAIECADQFLSAGAIVSTRGRSDTGQTFFARPQAVEDVPMAVLLNGNSASASEVLAGALVDNGRAIAVGERSLGKGVVQGVHPMPRGGGQLKITEQHYYLPSGRLLHRTDDSTEWGVDPTDGFYAPVTLQQRRDAVRNRREVEVYRKHSDEGRWDDAAWVLERLNDHQLTVAVEAVRGRLASGAWAPTGEPTPKGTLVLAERRSLEDTLRLLAREASRIQRRITALSDVEGPEPAPPPDLLPDDADLAGGTITIRDAQGNTIRELRITDDGLEPWLDGAPLEPISAE